MIELWEAVGRLATAAGLSGLIGFERQVAQKAAGMRTHMLVGLGAGLFTLLGAEAFGPGDPSRVAAQVVSGIGFLGAGAILRYGVSVRGLTTAAGLWTAAAVGVAAGVGELLLALAATTTALVVLYVLGFIDRLGVAGRGGTSILEVSVVDEAHMVGVLDAARDMTGREDRVAIQESGAHGHRILVTVDAQGSDEALMRLLALSGVERVRRQKQA